MNKYELALVLSPALDEEGRAAEVAKVQATLERFGAKIEKVDDWGKRKLAYEIQKMDEAFYYFIHFESENADCPNELEQQLRIMDGVIRYLVVRQDEE